MAILGSDTLFHTTQAWPVVVPLALGLIYAGLPMLDLAPRLLRSLGLAAIVAAAELITALFVSRHLLVVIALPIGGVLLVIYGVRLRLSRARGQAEPVTPPDAEPPATRYGVINRETGIADVSRAQFGEGLDVAIDNAGQVDAGEARFGVPKSPRDKPKRT